MLGHPLNTTAFTCPARGRISEIVGEA